MGLKMSFLFTLWISNYRGRATFGDKLFKMREGRQNLDAMELYQCLMEINAHFRSVVLCSIEVGILM